MKRLCALAAGLLLWSAASICTAASGVVLYYPAGCDFFLVETEMGMTLMAAMGEEAPEEGDILVGDYDLRGAAEVLNYSNDRVLEVWVEDYWMSEDTAIDLYLGYCG